MAINNDQNKFIRQHLENNYKEADFMERDRELEKYIILKSKLELKLLANLHSGKMKEWGTEYSQRLDYIKNEKIVLFIKGGTISYKSYGPNSHTIREKPYQLGDIWFSKDGEINIHSAHPTKKEIEEYWDNQKDKQDDNSTIWGFGDCATMVYPSMYHLQQRMEKLEPPQHCNDFYNEFKITPPTGVVHTPLVNAFTLLRYDANEEEAVRYLKNHYKIEDGVFGTKYYDGRTNWEQPQNVLLGKLIDLNKKNNKFNCKYYHYKNENNFTAFGLEVNSANKTMLPLSVWTNPEINKCIYLNLPPLKYYLGNLDKIKANKKTPIIITDSIEILADNHKKSDGVIWTTWYEGKETVKDVDWSPLKNRIVYYFIAKHPGASRKKAYEIAYAVFNELKKVSRIKLNFIEYIMIEGDSPGFFISSPADFEEKALLILNKEDELDTRDFKPLTIRGLISENLPERKLLLEPIIHESSTTMIYAKTNVGKTWFALCIAYCIAVKGTLFERWKAKSHHKVLYIDSEMDKRSLRDRIKIISKMKFDGRKYGSRHQNKFFCVSRERSRSDNESFKEKVTNFVISRKISLIVLDNLTAFTQHNDSASAWEAIHTWLEVLKKHNCAVILIHHTNKSGEQRGTSATTNAVDNVIRLEATTFHESKPGNKSTNDQTEAPDDESDHGLVMSVNFEKGRDIYGVAKKSLKVQIFPNAEKGPFCRLIPPSAGKKEEDNENDNKTGNKAESAPKSSKENNAPAKRKKLDENEVFEMLKREDTESMKDAAFKLGISVSRIYQIKDYKKHPAYKKMLKRNPPKKEKYKNRVLKLYTKGISENEIESQVGCSRATVRRIIEDNYMPHVEKLYKPKKSPASISQEMGIDEKLVTKIINKIEFEKVEKLFEKGKTREQIIASIKLPAMTISKEKRTREEERIGKKLDILEEAKQSKKDRQIHIREIHDLCKSGKGLKDIIQMIPLLPEKTIKTEYNRHFKQSKNKS